MRLSNFRVHNAFVGTALLLVFAFTANSGFGDEKPANEWIELKLDEEHWESCVFGGDGEIDFQKDQIVCDMGDPMTGIKLKKPFPKDEFEIELEANRLDGFDFFVGLTFPVADSHCSLVLGGWSGTVVGLSNINGYDASDNPTTVFEEYDNKKWYKIRLLVTKNRIAAWTGKKKIVDHPRDGIKFDIRGEMDASLPMGISTYQCKVAYRNIRYRSLLPTKVDVEKSKSDSK